MRVQDVASYIICLSRDIGEPVTNMKLQKLLYYSYVWSKVEIGETYKLFDDDVIQAWKFGPVIPSVYRLYSDYGADVIKDPVDGNPESLTAEAKAVIDDVFTIYGGKTAIELMMLTHSEDPWRSVYSEQTPNQVIPDELMYSFYKAKKARLTA